MRCREGRHRKAVIGEPRYRGKRCQVELQKVGPDDLAGDADVRDARLLTKRERDRWPPLQQPLISRQPLNGPILRPILDGIGVRAEHLDKVVADAQRHQRMRIGNRDQGEGSRIGAVGRGSAGSSLGCGTGSLRYSMIASD